jgi:hypothetical protein
MLRARVGDDNIMRDPEAIIVTFGNRCDRALYAGGIPGAVALSPAALLRRKAWN